MRFAIMSEPQQGMAYTDILALARTAEEARASVASLDAVPYALER